MLANELFDKTLDLIDKMAEEKKPASEIAIAVAKNMNRTVRDTSVIFDFLLHTTLNKYINNKKMNKAAECLLKEKSISKAMEYQEYNDQAAFSKAFKQIYGKTPKEFYELDEAKLVKNPFKWEYINVDVKEKKERETLEEKFIRHSVERYKKFIKLFDVMAMYGFGEEKYEELEKLAEIMQISEEEVIKFTNQVFFNDWYVDIVDAFSEIASDPEKYIFIRKIILNYDCYIDEAADIYKTLKKYKENIDKIEPEFWEYYFDNQNELMASLQIYKNYINSKKPCSWSEYIEISIICDGEYNEKYYDERFEMMNNIMNEADDEKRYKALGYLDSSDYYNSAKVEEKDYLGDRYMNELELE